MGNYYHSHRKRSIVKALTFRAISITTDLIIIYLFTRKIALSLGIALAANFTSTIMYYIHERAWNKVSWGREGK